VPDGRNGHPIATQTSPVGMLFPLPSRSIVVINWSFPRVTYGAVHPGLAIPVSAVDSRTQRLVELIKAAEKDGLPGIPGEESKDEAATRADDLDGNQHERLQKGFEFHG
jgi:hypothetical protein